MKQWMLMGALALAPAVAFGHVRLIEPTPRSPRDDFKSGPCGSAQPGTGERTTLTAGEQVVVRFDETIEHPGWFRVAFSPDGDGGYDANVLVDQIQPIRDGGLQHRYEVPVRVPDVECETCSLQVIQYMTENPRSPRLYFSCADVRVRRAVAPPDAAAPDADVVAPVDAGPRGDASLRFPDGGIVLPDGGFPRPSDPDDPEPHPDAGVDAGAVAAADESAGCAAAPVSGLAPVGALLLLGLRRRRPRP